MAPRKRRGDTVAETQYTERALRLAVGHVPKIVYLPAALRGHNQHVSLDNIQVRITGPQIIDNHLRIQEADPLGHLIAVMQGLPIPRFQVDANPHLDVPCPDRSRCSVPSHHGPEPVIRILYHTPTVEEQRDAAKWLAGRVTFKAPDAYKRNPLQAGATQHAHDYAAMIAEAAANTEEEIPSGEN